jgi:hypothetical protein
MGYPIIDVTPGLWVWQEDYAGWTPGNGWINPLNSYCVEADGEIAERRRSGYFPISLTSFKEALEILLSFLYQIQERGMQILV